MAKYLGEEILDITETIYAHYSRQNWIVLWLEMYKGVDGAHHKDWLLDQIARILHGAEVIVKIAKWDDGRTEERLELTEPRPEYWEWIGQYENGEDGPKTYTYDFGIAP